LFSESGSPSVDFLRGLIYPPLREIQMKAHRVITGFGLFVAQRVTPVALLVLFLTVSEGLVAPAAAAADGSWTLLAPTPSISARHYHSAVVISGKIYVFGGLPGAGDLEAPLNDLWVYDPASGTEGAWRMLAPSGTAPSPRYRHSAVAIAGKMYVIGGIGGDGNLYVYDPADGVDGTWSLPAPSGVGPATPDGHSAVVISGAMYLFGGCDSSTDLWKYDPSQGTSGTWRLLEPVGERPPGRCVHTAVTLAGEMYVFGGALAPGTYANDLYVYDPTAGADGTWTELLPTGAVPAERHVHSAFVLSGKMYVFGGGGNSGVMNDLHEFNPLIGIDGEWTALAPSGDTPSARAFASASVISGAMYLFGGWDADWSGAPLGDLHRWDSAAQPPTPVEQVSALVEEIAALLESGALEFGNADALTAKLKIAVRKLAAGETAPAIGLLNAFISQVQALEKAGRLAAEEAQSLIDAATDVIEDLTS
jgi:N-acetylneuraminic acid mutarotase